MKQKQLILPEKNSILVEYLSYDELFLMGFLEGFNRKSNEIIDKAGFEEYLD